MDIEEAIDNLDLRIRRLKIEYDRFFSGALETPPERMRQSINSKIHELRSHHIKSFTLRFRLTNLEARFNTFCVLFHRRLRVQEEGSPEQRRGDIPRSESFNPRNGILIDETPAREAIQALYNELYRSEDQPQADYHRFQTYLLQQVSKIRQRTGCSQVQFRVHTEGGKTKLKAKPV